MDWRILEVVGSVGTALLIIGAGAFLTRTGEQSVTPAESVAAIVIWLASVGAMVYWDVDTTVGVAGAIVLIVTIVLAMRWLRTSRTR